jgi:DNA-binding winged helix-turn-helix (wHTH) protein
MSTAEGREVFAFAGFSLDPRQRLLYGADGEPVPLNARAIDTLLYLVEHPDELIDKQTLLKAVWPNVIVEENNLKQNIAAIRRALRETPGEHRFIVTVPGRGFRFVPNVRRLVADMAPEDAPAPQESALSIQDPARHFASRKVEASAVETRGAERPSMEGKRWVPFATSALAAAATLAAALLAFLYFQQRPTTGEVVRFEVTLPEETAGAFAVAPDGRKMAYMVRGPDGTARLWVRSFETLAAQPVDGVEDADPVPNVFWSPDSRSVGFSSHGKLKRIDLAGGPALTICDAPTFKGGSWSRSGEIVFGTPLGLMKVSASGGLPTPLTSAGFAVPSSFLPDGRHFIYMQPMSQRGVYVGTWTPSPAKRTPKNSQTILLRRPTRLRQTDGAATWYTYTWAVALAVR